MFLTWPKKAGLVLHTLSDINIARLSFIIRVLQTYCYCATKHEYRFPFSWISFPRWWSSTSMPALVVQCALIFFFSQGTTTHSDGDVYFYFSQGLNFFHPIRDTSTYSIMAKEVYIIVLAWLLTWPDWPRLIMSNNTNSSSNVIVYRRFVEQH